MSKILKGIKKTVIRGKKSGDRPPMLSGDKVIVYDEKLSGQLLSRFFGEIKGKILYLNLYEACLLLDEEKIELESEGDKMNLKRLLVYAEKINECFSMKYDVYKDLRSVRGYIVKSGIKFGCDFVAYARGKSPGKDHSKWMVHVVSESARIDYSEITRAARLASNVKKKMLFASVTERGPVYYEISHARL